MEPTIYPFGIVNVNFGAGVKIINPVNMYGCSIGQHCFIGPFVEIQKDVVIGDWTKIQSHTFICELVNIGNHCFIGHGVMFINDIFIDGRPAGGDKSKWKSTKIGNNVSIGSNATILPVEICDNVTIAAGAVVTKNIVEPGIYLGNPAKKKKIANMHIPFVDLKAQYNSIKEEIDSAINRVLSETAFIGGEFVNKFEDEFAALYGVKHCISVGNGTDSLYIIMKMLGIGSGDEVITVANSWISSSETITQTGARPVFVDIHPDYYSLNELLLENAITGKTKAVIAVHLQGQMCDIEKIAEICSKHGIYLIEDCAQSHFSEIDGKRAGTIGIAGSFSFYPGKNLGAYGDAGCIVTNDDVLAKKFKMFARHGALKKNQHQLEGINSRMDGLQAAILSAKLPHILKWTDARIKHALFYGKCLSGIKGVIVPLQRPNTKHTFHLYVIRVVKRNELMDYLKSEGIETAIHYPTSLPNLPAYNYLGFSENDFPISSKYQSEILSLPMYPELTEDMIMFIAQKIKSFCKTHNE